jgi:hypothetical protein
VPLQQEVPTHRSNRGAKQIIRWRRERDSHPVSRITAPSCQKVTRWIFRLRTLFSGSEKRFGSGSNISPYPGAHLPRVARLKLSPGSRTSSTSSGRDSRSSASGRRVSSSSQESRSVGGLRGLWLHGGSGEPSVSKTMLLCLVRLPALMPLAFRAQEGSENQIADPEKDDSRKRLNHRSLLLSTGSTVRLLCIRQVF